MRAVVQRVRRARVVVDGEERAAIGAGLCVLVGIARGDGPAEAARLAARIASLRVLEGERSLLDLGGSALVVSQFTLLADTKRPKGTRPGYSAAAPKGQAEPLYEAVCTGLRDLGVTVETGVFGAKMVVEIVNDGPVTIIMDV
ncbi:MAG: D-tyrosyl-tRNA(Tyr) deacylase [Actinobacteria bacterium]|nr:D-tyrosyl-tRNA(Tyr) deacylase [Actinomycetota bacterium]